ncbi:MAG: hypothetical protein ABIO40_03505 [Devosia sp.]
MKISIKLAALTLAALTLNSTASLAGGLLLNHPVFIDQPRGEPTTEPGGGRGDGEWHVEHDEPPVRGGPDGAVVEVSHPVLTVSPYAVECIVWPNTFESGAAEIWFKNTGTKTIPAGSIITVKYSDGTTEQVEITQDLVPGASQGIKGSKAMSAGGFSCKATLKVKKLGLFNPTIGH